MATKPKLKGSGPHGIVPLKQVRLFISYSHKDKVWMERLKPLLEGFEYDDRLKKLRSSVSSVHAWHDKELPKGNAWDGEIKKELKSMDIFVPLVSSHFFSSWYVMKVELPAAEARGRKLKVLPILLYDVNLREKCEFLHQFPSVPAGHWSKFADQCDAHREIDDALWDAIKGCI